MRKTALLSTNEPKKIINSCRKLAKLGWRIIATRETKEIMQREDIPVEDIEQFTGVGYQYGVPPTLHPKIEQALTADCEEPIDLVYDVPYPLAKGNDVGGRTLLALGAKGGRLVINNYEDLLRVVELLEQNSTEINNFREGLIAKVNFEIAQHYLSLVKKYSGQYDGFLAEYQIPCREGENPYQVPCDLFSLDKDSPTALPQFTQLWGNRMCFTNMADMESVIVTLNKLKQAFLKNCNKIPYIMVTAKHGNPCGIGVDWLSQEQAILKALWGNPQAVWGGEVICNFEIDACLAQILLNDQKRGRLYGSSEWMLDVIIAPEFSSDALSILGKSKQRKLMSNLGLKRAAVPARGWRYRFIEGGFLRQPQADYILDLNGLIWIDSVSSDIDSLIIAWAASYTSFNGGNEVSIAKGSMLIGAGGGPSTVIAAQHAVGWAVSCNHEVNGAVFCADAFFPFTDAPEILVKAGCKAGVVPSGGKNYDAVFNFFKNSSISVGFIPAQYRGFCRH